MPNSTYPRDRFDDLPQAPGRVGAHRAENPHMRGWVVFFWALIATVILIALGIFGTLVVSGKVTLFPTPTPSATPTPVVTPVIDTSYTVLVLNATPETGLATQFRDRIVNAGWSADKVSASGAGSTDFPTTTIYYALPSDEAAALGLAQVVGGAAIAQSNAYQATDDPGTAADESQARQLTVVIGIDSTAAASSTPTP
ncbi:LytR C-terminal domain-containing protein [Microbacterium rhizomatis]|uniref:LytR family transcriptional regulator n=1 Tax=Microbacterium rhizomatis TaxID=1631477 RepID=A0A5J5J236_9MICO|nr:LytR C-terminal domain-containing protein [Microbacterium rhizomatis]KAA9107503.1 LytR family transcriptional regulator [Microbacterium rhizomatis]